MATRWPFDPNLVRTIPSMSRAPPMAPHCSGWSEAKCPSSRPAGRCSGRWARPRQYQPIQRRRSTSCSPPPVSTALNGAIRAFYSYCEDRIALADWRICDADDFLRDWIHELVHNAAIRIMPRAVEKARLAA